MLPYNNQSGHRSGGILPAAPPAKVKVIITTFVEVDTSQFKSAVQCLTGKESVVAEAPVRWTGNYVDHEANAAGERKRRREAAGSGGASVAKEEEEEEGELVEIMPAAALDEMLEWLRD